MELKERRDDLDIVLQAVEHNGRALRYAFDLRGNRMVVMKAVQQDGAALQFASSSLGDEDIVLAAINQNPLLCSMPAASFSKTKTSF